MLFIPAPSITVILFRVTGRRQQKPTAAERRGKACTGRRSLIMLAEKQTNSFTPTGDLQSPIKLTACVWMVEGIWTQRTQTACSRLEPFVTFYEVLACTNYSLSNEIFTK